MNLFKIEVSDRFSVLCIRIRPMRIVTFFSPHMRMYLFKIEVSDRLSVLCIRTRTIFIVIVDSRQLVKDPRTIIFRIFRDSIVASLHT